MNDEQAKEWIEDAEERHAEAEEEGNESVMNSSEEDILIGEAEIELNDSDEDEQHEHYENVVENGIVSASEELLEKDDD